MMVFQVGSSDLNEVSKTASRSVRVKFGDGKGRNCALKRIFWDILFSQTLPHKYNRLRGKLQKFPMKMKANIISNS